MNRPTHIITHHAASLPHHTVEDVNKWHRVRWPDFRSERGWWVGYHYVIEKDGTVTQTRNLHEEGAHCIGMNLSSIGVCLMGNFDNELPTEAQKQAFISLWSELYARFPNLTPDKIVPHRHYANKSCHGARLSDDYFARLLAPEIERRIVGLKALVIRLMQQLSGKRLSTRERNR